MSSRTRADALLAIEEELQSERAWSLRRLGDRLDQLLSDLRRLEDRLGRASEGERAVLLARHEDLWREADRQRWYMLVQREALGLRSHRIVDEVYPVPRRLSGRGDRR
jgi:hypothetical protein